MNKKVKVGVIGVGRIGKLHAENIARRLGAYAELVAVADVFLNDSIVEWANSLGVTKVYDDYKKIIEDPAIDAVIICSSTNTHSIISVEAANAGKHIFCEKPIDYDLEKIKMALDAVEKAGVKYQVGFNRRFDHNFRKVREMVEAGKVGNIEIVKVTARDPEPPSAEYARVSGGMFLDMSIHDFDMARYLSGSEVEEVYTNAAVLVDPAIGEAGDVDTALISLKFKNGSIGVIDNSRRAAYGYDQRVEVFGSKGSAEASNDTPTTVVLSTEEGVSSDKPKYFFLERYMDSFADEMKEFFEAIINDKITPVVGNDGLQPVLIGLAAKKSFAEGRPVKISELL
ncbi:inositol 2-dehydrogenase [Clostridium sp.]|uniref:inositol 2-dehydrogenase n=1 Tax=Clostridium sp. TaxID=1506 RepID=UPI003216241D